MRYLVATAAAMAFALLAAPAPSHAGTRANGTDTFVAEAEGSVLEAPGDLFATGNAVTLRGRTTGDAHLGGFNLDVESPIGGDLYAMGANVTLDAPVGSDATLAGWSVRVGEDGSVAGNARIAGGTVVVAGPIGGALTVAGADVTLDAGVEGDVMLMAETLAFGPDARIAGRLVYSSPAPVTIPPAVIPPERVTFEASEVPEAVREARRGWEKREWPSWPTALGVLSGGLLGVAFLLLVGGLFLGMAHRQVERTRAVAEARPGRSLLLGIAGLSLLLGLVPVLAITLIGLPLVPVALLLAVAGWLIGYLLGVYTVVWRIVGRLGGPRAPAPPETTMAEPLLSRILFLAIGLILAALLNFVPFLGWIANIFLTILGLGAITARLIDRVATRPVIAAAAPTPSTPSPTPEAPTPPSSWK